MRYVFRVVCISVVLSACSGVQSPPIVNINVGTNSSSNTNLNLTQNNSDNLKSQKDIAVYENQQGKSTRSEQNIIVSFEKPFSDPDSGVFIGVQEITSNFETSFKLFVPGKEPQFISRVSPGWEKSVVGLSGPLKIRLLSTNIVASTISFSMSR